MPNLNEMSSNHLLQFLLTFFFFFLLFPIALTAASTIVKPEPALIQPLLTNSSSQATIPAFPEQSNLSGCPLDLPEELFNSVSLACSASKADNTNANAELKQNRCCPVLAAWLYSAYSTTALSRATNNRMTTQSYDMPALPDDSETCVSNLENALRGKGIQLLQPNQTCDLVYCYCGIRLQPLSCPEAFSVSQEGKLVGGENVKRLEKDCLSNNQGFSSLAGCSKCLNSLYQLNGEKSVNSSNEERKSKMQNKDCELMGLTWLLAENRTAYIPTVVAVIRAVMMSDEGSEPKSCGLTSDGMPLAVGSAELDNHSSSTSTLVPPAKLTFVLMHFVALLLSTMF